MRKLSCGRVVSSAVDDLVANGDIAEQTPREYVVGHLCEKLKESGFQRIELCAGADIRYVIELAPTSRKAKAS